jgi:hypothetical protein
VDVNELLVLAMLTKRADSGHALLSHVVGEKDFLRIPKQSRPQEEFTRKKKRRRRRRKMKKKEKNSEFDNTRQCCEVTP